MPGKHVRFHAGNQFMSQDSDIDEDLDTDHSTPYDFDSINVRGKTETTNRTRNYGNKVGGSEVPPKRPQGQQLPPDYRRVSHNQGRAPDPNPVGRRTPKTTAFEEAELGRSPRMSDMTLESREASASHMRGMNSFLMEPEAAEFLSSAHNNVDSQGIDAGMERDGDERDKAEHLTTTCWIAAERALQHARIRISSISEVFYRWKIQESEYIILAGFDESLIKSGVGYLEQIHVFVSAEVDATSPLLSELGKVFSPFSSIMFTASSSYHIPVFKDDGNVWEFDEFIHLTASKFANQGSSSKMPQTVIGLSQTPSLADGFSQDGSGSGGEKKGERTPQKGKARSRGDEGEDEDEDEADKGDRGGKGRGDPEGPPGDEGSAIARLPKIFFEIVSEIYPIQYKENAFQTLTIQGSLVVQTTPPTPRGLQQFSKRRVKFTKLTFGTEWSTDIAYKQFHVRVAVNSRQKNAYIEDIQPKRTPASEREEKRSLSTKIGRTRGVTASLNLGLHPQAAITGTVMKANEQTAGSETKRYTSRITEQHKYGIVLWGFNVDDRNEQEQGIDMSDDVLPTVHFKFVGKPREPPPSPPERMDICILSYWSMILPSGPKDTWLRKLFHFFRSSGNTQMPSYSNLFQIVALDAAPSHLPEQSYYMATVHVNTGAGDSDSDVDVRIPTEDSVVVRPVVSDGLRRLRTLNLPMIGDLILSDNCRQSLPQLDSDSKSH